MMSHTWTQCCTPLCLWWDLCCSAAFLHLLYLYGSLAWTFISFSWEEKNLARPGSPQHFPTNEVHILPRAWPSPVPWPSLNGNFPFFQASLPLCHCRSGVTDSCPEQAAGGRLIHKPSYTSLPLLDWLAEVLGNWLPDLLKGWLIAGVGGLKWDKGLDIETLIDIEQCTVRKKGCVCAVSFLWVGLSQEDVFKRSGSDAEAADRLPSQGPNSISEFWK